MTTFKKAVSETANLTDSWKPGLEALREKDKTKIRPEDTRAIKGSIDLDTAMQEIEPNANRWDFAVAFKHTNKPSEFIYWIETHTGGDSEISKILLKLAWLRNWLRTSGQKLNAFDKEFIWIPSGATTFTKGSKQIKQLASKGIIYSGSRFNIPNKKD